MKTCLKEVLGIWYLLEGPEVSKPASDKGAKTYSSGLFKIPGDVERQNNGNCSKVRIHKAWNFT